MRNAKSKNITLESGILFCRRNFKFIGENNFISSSNTDVGDLDILITPLNALALFS